MRQELFKSPLDGPNWNWQPDSPSVTSNDKLAFFMNQRMKNASKWDCIACKPLPLVTPVVLRAPTLDEWIINEHHRAGRQVYGHPNHGGAGSMQLVAMQVELTNIGMIDAVAGTFEVRNLCLSLHYCRILSDTHVQWFNL